IPSFIHPEEGLNLSFYASFIAMIVAGVLAFVLTYFFGDISKEEATTVISEGSTNQESKNNIETEVKSEIITSPLTGKMKKLDEIDDTAFASGALGKGIAIEPTEGKLVAPVS